MTRRTELLALSAKLIAMADDHPSNISLGAATCLAQAAQAIGDALLYAVSADEQETLRKKREAAAA